MNLILQDFSQAYSLPTLLLNSLTSPLLACCIKFDEDGKILAAGTIAGSIIIWDMQTLMISFELFGHASSVSCISFSKNSEFLLSSSHDWNIILWDLNSQSVIYKLPFDGPMLSACLHPYNPFEFLAIGEFAWCVNLDLENKIISRKKLTYSGMSSTDLPCCIKYDLSGSLICSSTTKGEFIILNKDLTLLNRIKVASRSITGFCFSLNNELIVNSSDGIVRLFELCDNSLIYKTKFVESVEKIRWIDIGFSNEFDYIISGSSANNAHNIYIWEKGKGTLIKKLEGPKEGLSDVKWHPKRPLIASLSSLGNIFLWSVNYVQNFSAFAPSFTETDDNIEYIEREDEFDQKDVISKYIFKF